MALSFSVTRWSAWAPGLETLEEWERHDGAELALDRETKPEVKELPMMLRRRLSRLGRMAMRVALDSGASRGMRLVFSSRYGEAAQTVDLLTSLSKKEGMSPTAFSMSVHNALAGLLSITQKNQHPHTAIAAGEESFCTGLMEAAALLVEDNTRPVLLVHYDEPLPEFYMPYVDENVPSLALAMVLEVRSGNGMRFDFGFSPKSPEQANESQDASKSFINFLAKNELAWSWSAANRNWWCRRDAA